MGARAVLCASCALWVLSTPAAALAQPAEAAADGQAPPGRDPAGSGQPGRIETRTSLEAPLEVNGRFLGSVSVEVDAAGAGAIDAGRFIELVRPALSPDLLAALEARIAGRRKAEMADLSSSGIAVRFDPESLTVKVDVAASGTAETRLTVVTRDAVPDPAAYDQQEDFSLGLNLAIGQRIVHDGGGFQPIQASLAGFANLGGFEGVTLTGGFDYNGGDDSPWRRREFRLTKDFYSSAIRATGGEFTPLSFGFQGSGRLLGVGVERAYSTIRPFQNVRPVGRQLFTIERESRVEVFVNDIRTETLLLAPGRYDISDFPFATGPNRVRLEVEDPAGRREIASFDVFSDASLLSAGVTEFGAAVGLREEGGSLRYGGPAATGFILRGMSDVLTLGAHAQVTERAGQAGLVAAWGTPIGFVQAEAAASRGRFGRMGAALAVDYRGEFSILERNDLRVVLSGLYRTRDFQDAFVPAASNPQVWQVAAQAQWRAPWRLSLGLGYFYSAGRDDFSDQQRVDLSLGRSFGRFSLNSTVSHVSDGDRRDLRVALGLSVRLGPRWYGTARYDSRRGLKEIEVSRATNGELDDVSGEIRIGEDRDARGLSGRVAYINNRFDLVARHDRSVARREGGASFAQSSWNLSTFVGYAGGRVAVGRQSTEGFLIASRHPTLSESRLELRSGDRVVARTDFLGPALYPISRAYGVQRLETVVDPLPTAYDLGSGSVSVFPGYGAGYSVTVGSDASRIAVGTLVGADGPLSLVGGTVVRVGDESSTRPFFTNRSGRFVAEGLAPGRYRILIGGRAVGEFDVSEDQEGMVDVGTVRTTG